MESKTMPSLGQFLTEEDKVAALEQLRTKLYEELYTLCIRAAIDPDDVDYQTWVLPAYSEETAPSYQTLQMIDRMCQSLIIIDEKLS